MRSRAEKTRIGRKRKSVISKEIKSGAPSNGKRKILVMDDDPFVRTVIRDMLVESGYKVHVARDGVEAIERFKTAAGRGRPFDAVILDLLVPKGMGGDEAIAKLREMYPDVNAILLTGDITHRMISDYEICGFKAALIKPFTRGELLQALHWASAKSSDLPYSL